jgi:hypothetical protein
LVSAAIGGLVQQKQAIRLRLQHRLFWGELTPKGEVKSKTWKQMNSKHGVSKTNWSSSLPGNLFDIV